MRKLLIICGPTATGKTSLGIELAKKYSAQGGPASGWTGEIVSADSRQVYKGMDVGTGKDVEGGKWRFSKIEWNTEARKIRKHGRSQNFGYWEVEGISVWGLDLVEPDEKFSVAHWVGFAKIVIENIWKRGKLPIVVGGTGFWIKTLIEGIDSIGIPPDWKLRKKLSNCSIAKLSNCLKKLNPKRWRTMNESDRKNPRRLIRAIEIAKQYKKLNIKYQKHISKIKNKNKKLKIDNLLILGLKIENKTLYERIDKRVEERVKMGAEKEIRNLLKKGYNFENSVLGTTIGYKEWQLYIKGVELRKEIIQRWKFSEHAYARRQMSWFKTNKNIKWFDISKPAWKKDIAKLVKSWYSKSDAEG